MGFGLRHSTALARIQGLGGEFHVQIRVSMQRTSNGPQRGVGRFLRLLQNDR